MEQERRVVFFQANTAMPVAKSLPSDRPTRLSDEEFVRLLGLSQGRVFSFVITLLPDWSEAEEVVARMSVVLWKKLGEFDPEGDFVRWACGIAYRQTLAYLRERRREHLTLSLDVLDQIAQARLEHDQLLEQRRRALRGCQEKLPPSDRQIIDAYYGATRKTAAEVGSELGRPTNTILKALIRIRRALHLCIDRTIARGESWVSGEPS
jgi:RNA polymerase sigma-70 factor (ECF subfamily)